MAEAVRRAERENQNMMGAPGELVLDRRALRQPQPEIHKGGDCGACSLGGALGIAVQEVYRLFTSDGITQTGEMARCLRCAAIEKLADRIIDEHAEWPYARYFRSFGHPSRFESLQWFNYVRMAVDAGYYGLAKIDFARNGGPDTNHWVLICGARTLGIETDKTLTGDVLLSCSVTGESWVEAAQFLEKCGGYDILFVRPIGAR
jgi:hypothetical protein